MGRQLRPDEIGNDLDNLLRHCIAIADSSGLWLTAAHIAQAMYSFSVESAALPDPGNLATIDQRAHEPSGHAPSGATDAAADTAF